MPEAGNELVMSNEEIAAELSSTGDEGGEVEVQEEETSELDSDVDVPDTWTDDSGDGEGDDAEDDTSAQETDRTVRQIKANGKTHEVNMADQARVDQLLALGLGARQVFTERDQLRKQVSVKDKQIAENAKYKGLWEKLEAAKAKGKHALYKQIFDVEWADDVKAYREEQEAYEKATPEERRLMDAQRKAEEILKAAEDRERKWAEREKEVEEKSEKAQIKEVRAQLLPEFHKFEFSSKVKDAAQAERLNDALWALAIRELKKQGDVEELPPETISKAFKSVHDMLWANAKQSAKEQVKQITEKKKAVAKTQAKVAATRNYTTTDANKLAKEKDPVKLFEKMFGRR